jgi:tetratricopeptide (TPR) repeat protein
LSPQRSGTETSIRQLIANGKSKTALDNAKEFHKKQGTADSEILLIDAYLARIKALFDQNLPVEAKSLMTLVGERFPSAKERLDALSATASARGGDLDELLRPLNDPGIDAERRASIEQFIQNQVTDLAPLAGCTALPPEHSLRQAAAAIDNAFNVVTSGPVTDEQIALPEVSHRSPLAQWKLLIRAIACFHRGQDETCEEFLAAIKPESAPYRLVHAMRAILAAQPGTKVGGLKPAEEALASRTNASLVKFRAALANLDRAFAHDDEPSQVLKAIRTAVQECRHSAPDLLGELRKMVCVKGEVGSYDMERVIAALEGAPRRDALFCRDVARALERSGDSEDLLLACEWWEDFRLEAVREGRFNERSLEVAALYLHMAGLLGRMPKPLLREMQRPFGQPSSRETNYFRFPDQLYQRAAAIDGHPDVFSQWLQWARGNSIREAENVARAWNKALPDAVEPLLFLMEQSEKRNAFPTALSYLDKAERIDAVSPTVRTARLRLLAAGALRNLQQNKPHLAAQRLAQIAALPQSQQGDRPAFLAALRFLICHVSGDKPGSDAARLEVERALGDSVAGSLLIFGCAAFAKRHVGVLLPLPKELGKQQRSGLPASMAKVLALAKDVGLLKFQLPVPYFAATEAQFQKASAALNIEQIRSLGEFGIATNHPRLAWEASAAGLARGGPTEAHFLLLRAEALPDGLGPRHEVLMAAAAELGRSQRDMEVVSQAVEGGRNPFNATPLSLTAEQARAVLAKEKAHPAFPSRFGPGPDYSEFFNDNGCMCPACCARRGERFDPDRLGPDLFDEFEPDEDEMERSFFETAPKGIPREILPALFEVAKEAFYSGENPEELLARILLEGEGGKKKKGKRK